MLLKVTLDANAFIYAFDFEHKSPVAIDDLHALIAHAFRGAVNIALASALIRDLENDRDDERKREMLSKLGLFPMIPSPTRLDFSALDGADTLASETDKDMERRLASILHPKGLDSSARHFRQHANDIDHLLAHARAKRDIFVTSDRMHKKAEFIEAETGIVVLTPPEALDRVERTVNFSLMGADFCSDFAALSRLLDTASDLLMRGERVDADETEYALLRGRMLRTWPKLRPHYHAFLSDHSDAWSPFDSLAPFKAQQQADTPPRFFERERLFDEIADLLTWAASVHDRADLIGSLRREGERQRTHLAKFVGHLEAIR